MSVEAPEVWAELATWGREQRMTELEASMWRGERHPANATSGLVLELLDSEPDWDRVRSAHEWMIGLVPRLRERVVEPVLPVGVPIWAEDPAFDLDYHLRRVRLPAPGTERQLLELAASMALTPIDHSRPPWVGWLVEGLDGDRAAYVLQTHHCLFDGHGVIQLLSRIHSQTPEPRQDRAVVPAHGHADPGQLGLLADALRRSVPDPVGFGRAVAGTVLRGPARAAGDLRRVGSALRRALVPPPAQPSPLMQGSRRRAWRYATVDCELDGLKAAAKAGGGSVNDAYVAAVLGGMARYHDERGVPLGDIPMTMPVSTRRPDDPAGGNRFVAAFFAAPSSVRDPARRIAALGAAVREVRDDLGGVDVMGALLPIFNRAPAPVLAAAFSYMQARSNLTASNVPGIPFPVYLAGAAVERMYFFGPLPGSALTTVLLSHNGRCCIGLTYDGEVFDDHDLLVASMLAGLDEVLALA